MDRARTTAACLGAALLAGSGCGLSRTAPLELATVGEALAAGSEELDLASPACRARLFGLAELQARAQADAPAPDSPALFAVEVGSLLLPAPLPSATSLRAGAEVEVDVDSSADPWPRERREGLAGSDERSAARAAASALADALHLGGKAIVVERDAGAPYAVAWAQGRLRLNPALLYLAAAEGSLASSSAPEQLAAPSASCSSSPGAPALELAALLALARSRRRRG